jgi:hypothetical protein
VLKSRLPDSFSEYAVNVLAVMDVVSPEVATETALDLLALAAVELERQFGKTEARKLLRRCARQI